MLGYGIIMFLTASLLAVVALRIYRGNTDLIHDYHQTNVTDKPAYGKAFAKSLGILPAAMACSGLLALLGISMGIAVAVLLIGLTAGIVGIVNVQKRYNGGMFG